MGFILCGVAMEFVVEAVPIVNISFAVELMDCVVVPMEAILPQRQQLVCAVLERRHR